MEDSFPGIKRPGRENDHLPHLVARMRMRGAMANIHCPICLQGVHGENSTMLLLELLLFLLLLLLVVVVVVVVVIVVVVVEVVVVVVVVVVMVKPSH